MAWLELHIETTAEHADVISDELAALGAEAITMKDAGDQPIYEPALDATPIWQETILVGLFGSEQELAPVATYLNNQQKNGLLKGYQIIPLADQDWERTCLEDFKPLQFGKRLWICPSWLTTPDSGAVNIILDPGLAFGTGTHPTTSLCLEWLDANIEGGETVIDFGCGSGILALAALKLGAKCVLAVDHDPQALMATVQNGERNQLVAPQLITYHSDEFSSEPVDIMAANILAQPLIELAPLLSHYVKSGGKLLLSGILLEQAEEVSNAYLPWFKMQPPVSKGDWVRLSGVHL